jgi:hypothetical protein
MYDMVRFFNLQRRPVCKYNACIDAYGAAQGGFPLLKQEEPLAVSLWTS